MRDVMFGYVSSCSGGGHDGNGCGNGVFGSFDGVFGSRKNGYGCFDKTGCFYGVWHSLSHIFLYFSFFISPPGCNLISLYFSLCLSACPGCKAKGKARADIFTLKRERKKEREKERVKHPKDRVNSIMIRLD